MKYFFRLVGLLTILGLFQSAAHAAGEAEFWNWFQQNEERLFAGGAGSEETITQLGAELRKVNEAVTFEFGPIFKDGKKEFVITADGNKTAFPAVEALYASAPELPRWIWVKFRPRRAVISDMGFGDRFVKSGDVNYLMFTDADKVGIMLFFDEYNADEEITFGQIGYLMLDEALGEYAVETQVGLIEFQPRTSEFFAQSSPLKNLPAQFDEYWAGKR
ncbi:MAG TPA: hypothetical protein VHB46_11170 [Burkholderiales bacterium]|nr:hypothetical protein [Burkholderiales bacterium]